MVMMPSQTNGLNQLPRQLYPDGTAVMNTLQQVSGAIGTAVAITIMSSTQKAYLANAADPSAASTIRQSLTVWCSRCLHFWIDRGHPWAHLVYLY